MSVLFLIATIAGRTVAIDTHHIDAVVDLTDLVSIPRTSPAIRGLAALRSRVVTVIDTALALGLAPMSAEARRAITARIDGHSYGFLVEALEDVASFEPQALSLGLALDRGWRLAGRGIVERDGKPILILDLAALLPSPAALAA
ncbi:chemotaxis protein CheW [Sphingomonas bacterium]|uniref:chemotaxis protein CheW n=1 Tax=Sphingomonas bacterium TaxID=1895847 RepID=UPI00157553DE|nr:chemotaxis protein CheW [Sphingomonas bacterium]